MNLTSFLSSYIDRSIFAQEEWVRKKNAFLQEGQMRLKNVGSNLSKLPATVPAHRAKGV